LTNINEFMNEALASRSAAVTSQGPTETEMNGTALAETEMVAVETQSDASISNDETDVEALAPSTTIETAEQAPEKDLVVPIEHYSQDIVESRSADVDEAATSVPDESSAGDGKEDMGKDSSLEENGDSVISIEGSSNAVAETTEEELVPEHPG
jgi:hypothetical protein